MTDEEIVARAVHAAWYADDIAPTLDDERSRGDPMAVQRCERLAAAVVAALAEAGRLVPEGVTVRYGWQSGESSPAAWSASRVAVEQP